MLGFQTAVPIYPREIKFEFASLLVDGNVHIIVAGENFKWKCPEFTFGPHDFGFVDHSAHFWIFVFEDLRNQVFIREPSLSEIQMYCPGRLASPSAPVWEWPPTYKHAQLM